VPAWGTQRNWRRCDKCQGLWFGGDASQGKCPEGGTRAKTGSGNYSLVRQASPTPPNHEANWRCCSKCQGLWFGPKATQSNWSTSCSSPSRDRRPSWRRSGGPGRRRRRAQSPHRCALVRDGRDRLRGFRRRRLGNRRPPGGEALRVHHREAGEGDRGADVRRLRHRRPGPGGGADRDQARPGNPPRHLGPQAMPGIGRRARHSGRGRLPEAQQAVGG
jgi:hypothetical protein